MTGLGGAQVHNGSNEGWGWFGTGHGDFLIFKGVQALKTTIGPFLPVAWSLPPWAD